MKKEYLIIAGVGIALFFLNKKTQSLNGIFEDKKNKVTISIYKGDKLIAKSIVKSLKEENEFIKKNLPIMTMTQKVKEDWKIFKSY